jgi:superfamily II DNA or RNA helicase
MAELFEPGQRVRLPHGPDSWLTVDLATPDPSGGWILYVAVDGQDTFRKVSLTPDEAAQAEIITSDGRGSSAGALAGMWSCWMAAASCATSTHSPFSPLRPYAHQANAVYGAMLPQPLLRFLLADEPGTGKTIMAGLYVSEMRRLKLINRVLIVTPAGLVTKWQADVDRFFNGGLRRITADTVREHALDADHALWVVSLELAAVNTAVQDAIRPDQAGWDLVIFDEAHRLTPTAQSFHRVGRLLTTASPRVLLMTATPHRGSEWLFRHLLHLVDPDIYPNPGDDPRQRLSALRPGSIHFLRRMKEDLVDYDGVTPLFKRRRATNFRVPLSPIELEFYTQALEAVDKFFPPSARPLARMVYGKRAASSLYALSETLRRRLAHMGEMSAAEAAAYVDPEGDDQPAQDEARVVHFDSQSPRLERSAVSNLLSRITVALRDSGYVPSKWRTLVERCLLANGIQPASREQAVIFTEYADSAAWIAERLTADGYTARIYSGRQSHSERDEVRAAFMLGDFQVIVSTDAGNEGIDLQVAHVLVNFDIPWSLVRLEQRMGRIHRVGQTRDVELYNLIAAETREGDTLHTLLDNFVTAANELDGRLFDCLSLVAELTSTPFEEWLQTLYGDDELKKSEVFAAVRRVSAADLKRQAELARNQESQLATGVDAMANLARSQRHASEQVSPAVVEAYLGQLSTAGVLRVRHTAAGEGILAISADRPLPESLGATDSAVVATSDEAMRGSAAVMVSASTVPLTPSSMAFADLVATVRRTLAPDAYRGGMVEDPTATNGYELFAFRSKVSSHNARGGIPWSALIRVDADGNTHQVFWESLLNLMPSDTHTMPPDPVRAEVAASEARRLLAQTVAEEGRVRREWLAMARRDLTSLPVDLTHDVHDRTKRIALRDKLSASAIRRLAHLEDLCHITAEPPRLTARLQVEAGASINAPEQRQADSIALDHARGLLETDGWAVENVRADGRGYDLQAMRGREQRLITAKGAWLSIRPQGVRLRGDELLVASQRGQHYWLYVVEHCSDGLGTLFGAFRNPIDAFGGDVHGEAFAWLSGPVLDAARERACSISGDSLDQETP